MNNEVKIKYSDLTDFEKAFLAALRDPSLREQIKKILLKEDAA